MGKFCITPLVNLHTPCVIQAAVVAELAGQEARYAAMLTALQETVGQAVAETAASRAVQCSVSQGVINCANPQTWFGGLQQSERLKFPQRQPLFRRSPLRGLKPLRGQGIYFTKDIYISSRRPFWSSGSVSVVQKKLSTSESSSSSCGPKCRSLQPLVQCPATEQLEQKGFLSRALTSGELEATPCLCKVV
jgi:hypothetical protein